MGTCVWDYSAGRRDALDGQLDSREACRPAACGARSSRRGHPTPLLCHPPSGWDIGRDGESYVLVGPENTIFLDRNTLKDYQLSLLI